MTLAPWLLAISALVWSPTAFAQTRIKDITSIQGVRSNHIVGYGLVVGLNGTGDSLRNAPFAQQSMQSMLDRMGVNIRGTQARTRNVAAVMVMAELPAFATPGNRIDVSVASLGDATSLVGGSLLLTPLSGANDSVYAVAQGPVIVSAVAASGRSESLTKGIPTSARIPNGAVVERDAPGKFDSTSFLALELRNPDFKTAVEIADAINRYAKVRFNKKVAEARDLRTITIDQPASVTAARLIAEIGELKVTPDAPARVVVDERTGTIVIGHDTRISPVAVAYGDVTVRVTETPHVSQPMPFSKGHTAVVSDTQVSIDERGGAVNQLSGATLQSIVSGLNRLGLRPAGIIAVLQALKSAGALHAELVVQ